MTRFKMSDFYLKQRDTRPILEVALKNPDGTAHDLTGADSVTLNILLSTGVLISRDMEIDSDPTTGLVGYTWLTSDWTDGLVAGTHLMEYEVLDATGDVRMTFPNYGSDNLIVTADLGEATP